MRPFPFRAAFSSAAVFIALIFSGISGIAGCAAGDGTGGAEFATSVSVAPFSTQPVVATDACDALAAGFDAAPKTMRTGCYWYWLNDNISVASVTADLRAMKRAGINRAFIAHVGDVGRAGNVKMFSAQWRECLRAALKTAGELDIEIGLFNCPGWSQSGGPWHTADTSMRRLATVERRVAGPRLFSETLTPAQRGFRDVKVLAFPARHAEQDNLLDAVPADKKPAFPLRLTGGASVVEFSLPQAKPARSLMIFPDGKLYARCEFQARGSAGGEYKTLASFLMRRVDNRAIVGFDPQGPIVVNFPETTAADFRLVLRDTAGGSKIKKIVLSRVPVPERYVEKTLGKLFRKMSQNDFPRWNEYMWDAQSTDTAFCAQPAQVRDISKHLAADGTLTWQVPAGDWVILRTGMVPTGVTNAPVSPEGRGLEVDKMSRKHIAFHFDAYIKKILDFIPKNERKTLTTIVADSYETGGQNFTDGMLEKFQKRYGYDATPFLPAFAGYVIGSPDQTDRFLWDVRRFVADEIANEYVGGLTDAANKHGLKTWLEPYGHWGFPGDFLSYGAKADMVGGEFWAEDDHTYENRAAASCAHIYGKKKVSAESFTSVGHPFSYSPAALKSVGDKAFCEGINDTVLHVCISQPDEMRAPGLDAWFGVEFNRKNTWFAHLDLFTDYLKRCNFLLQQGTHVADIAYYIGEDAPKQTGICEPAPPAGFDYDYINSDVILNRLRVGADGELLLPDGKSYRVLVLPPQDTMRPEVLRKIIALARDGATILGTPPVRSPSLKNYPNADKEVEKLTQEFFGKGGLLTPPAALSATGSPRNFCAALGLVPDFQWDDPKTPLLYTHRKLTGNAAAITNGATGGGNVCDIYFVSNRSDKTVRVAPAFRVAGAEPPVAKGIVPESVRVAPEFRVSGARPELWDAVTGERRPAPAFARNTVAGTTTVPLELPPNGSIFVVFVRK